MNITSTTPAPPARGKVIAAFATVYLFWGSTYLAIRVAVATVPPFLMAGLRYLVAGAVMMAWLRHRGLRPPTARQWREAAITGTFLLLGGNGIVCWAEQSVNSSLAALILTSSPIWFAVFDTIRPGGRRQQWQTILGILVGSTGIALLVFGSPTQGSIARTSLTGAFALVVACAFWAGGSLYNKYHTEAVSPWMATAAQMLCGGAANCIMALILGEWFGFHPSQVAPSSLLAMVYLIVFGSLAGYSAYVWLLGHCAPAKVATYAYVNPIIATFLGWLILHEPLTPAIGLAAVIILAGVLIVQWPSRAT